MVVCSYQGHGQDQNESKGDGTVAGIEKPDGGKESGEDRHVARGKTAVLSPPMEPVEVVVHLVCKPDPRVGPSENVLEDPFQEIGKGDGAAGELEKPCLLVVDPLVSEDEVVTPEKTAAKTDQQEEKIRNIRGADLKKVAGFQQFHGTQGNPRVEKTQAEQGGQDDEREAPRHYFRIYVADVITPSGKALCELGGAVDEKARSQ